TPVNVAEEVEGPVVGFPVIPERLALDLDRVDVLRRLENEDVPEALLLKIPLRALHLARLLADHVRTEVPLRPVTIALLAQPLGQVENDRDRQDMILSGERDEGLPRLGLHIGRVHDRELAAREPPARDET